MIEYDAKKHLDATIGDPTTTSVVAVVKALAAGNVTLTVPGASGSPYTVTMTAIGTDNTENDSEACFVGEQTISGLGPTFQRYSYTATQGAHSFSGSFKNEPGETDTYSFAVLTCQDPFEIETWDGIQGESMWPYIQQRMQANDNFVGVMWVDDLFYSDSLQINAGVVGATKVSTGQPQITLKVYDYVLTYMTMLGMIDDGPSLNLATEYGRHAPKNYCMANGWFLPQWGNHEFSRDLGTWIGENELGTAGKARPNAFHSTASPGFDGPGMVAWDAFWRPLQPSELSVKSLDTACNLWGFDLGPLRVIALDNLTNNNGVTASSSAFGANQLSDALTAMQSSHAFKLVLSQHSIRQVTGVGAHFPLDQHVPAEGTRLISDAAATPPSIMESRYTNGVQGTTILAIGDTHGGRVHRFIGEGGGIVENLYAFTGMDANKQLPHTSSSAPDGTEVSGVLYEYIQRGKGGSEDPETVGYVDPEGRSNDHALIITVNGTARTMTAEFVNRKLDNSYEVEWSGTWYAGKGNRPYANAPAVVQPAAVADL